MNGRLLAAGTTLGILLLTAASPEAQEWTRFRGPNGTGVSASTGLPVEIGGERSVEWATEVPFGRSSPALTEDRIFLTAMEDGELLTLAVGRDDGELLWTRSLEPTHRADLHEATDSSTASPVTDGENVFVFFHEAGLVSYDADGNERWRFELGPFRNFYGIAASPVLAGDKLLFVCDQVEGSFLLALDAATGKEIWRQERPLRAESYTTPILYPDSASPSQVLILGSKWLDSYDLESGESLWSSSGVGAGPVASPALVGDVLVVSAPDHASEPMPPFGEITKEHDGNADGVLERAEVETTWMKNHFGFVDVDGNGSISESDWTKLGNEMTSDHWGIFGIRLPSETRETEILWNVRQSVPYIPSPLIYEDVAYVIKDSIITSLDPTTGKVHKRGRLGKEKAQVYASPIAADGKVYLATVSGKVAVLDAGQQWSILAVNDLGDEIYATPAVSDGHLYVRTKGRLFSFRSPSD